jgi:hypothetical protein
MLPQSHHEWIVSCTTVQIFPRGHEGRDETVVLRIDHAGEQKLRLTPAGAQRENSITVAVKTVQRVAFQPSVCYGVPPVPPTPKAVSAAHAFETPGRIWIGGIEVGLADPAKAACATTGYAFVYHPVAIVINSVAHFCGSRMNVRIVIVAIVSAYTLLRDLVIAVAVFVAGWRTRPQWQHCQSQNEADDQKKLESKLGAHDGFPLFVFGKISFLTTLATLLHLDQ